MLASLFARLTGRAEGAGADRAPLFDRASEVARQPSLYSAGGVPDTIDGRFSALASAVALVLVRLERDGSAGTALSVRITERFVEVMDAEHRELGLGDPTVGKTVRKLVTRLAQNVDRWRAAVEERAWTEAVRNSIPLATVGSSPSVAAGIYRNWWDRLDRSSLEALTAGTVA